MRNIIKTRMIGAFILVLLLWAAIGNRVVEAQNTAGKSQQEPLIELTAENLENFLDEYLPSEMEKSRVPGLVITVVRGDEVLLLKGYGYADLENKTPMTPETNIRAGSVSKSILATGVIRLVELGLLDLDAPASTYISDLQLEDEFGAASTIGQLLTHTSGYQDNLVLSHSPDLDSQESLAEVLQGGLPSRSFAPGLVSSYSDWNYSLLGYAIEEVADKPYQTVMEEVLFEPLGMDNTTYQQPLPDEIAENLAVGYGWNYAKFRFDIVPHDYVRMSPGIALITNGSDMAAYLQMLLQQRTHEDKQLLSEESLALLLERQGSAHELSRGWSYGFVENTISGRRVLYKDGNGIGFASRVVILPDQDLALFVSTNHRNLGEGLWPTQASMMATRTLVAAIFEAFVPESEVSENEIQPAISEESSSGRFEGHYQKAGISRNDFFKLEGLLDNVDVKENPDGTLVIGSGTYHEVEPLVFQNLNSPNFHIIFVENPEGEVEFLTFGGTGSYQKAAWHQGKNFQIVLLATIALVSLVSAVIWFIKPFDHWFPLAVSLLNVSYIAGVALIFVPMVTDMLIFFSKVPITVKFIFILPWIIVITTIVMLAEVVIHWKRSEKSWWSRIQIILLGIVTVALVWMANFWNLIIG